MSIWDKISGRLAGTLLPSSPWADQSHLDSITPEIHADIYGADATDIISRSTAMTIPAIARMRNLLASTVARMPLVAFDAEGPLATQPALVTQPETGRTPYETKLWLVDQLFFHGHAYAIGQRRDARTERFTGLHLVPTTMIDFDPAGNPTGANGVRVPTSEWIRFDGPTDGILNYGARTMRAAVLLETAATRLADNPVPAIELHQETGDPLTEDEIDKLIARWSAARRKSTGGVAFTNAAVTTKTHGAPTEHLLIKGRDAIALDLARMASMPAWVIDAAPGGSSITYANVTDRMRDYIDWSAGPFYSAIEARLSADDLLPAGVWCRFDPTDLLRGDLKTQADAYTAAIAAGIMTTAAAQAHYQGRPQEKTE